MSRQSDATALGDVRVLELSTGWGMYAGKLLADLGADVIKIDPPSGSPQQKRGPFVKEPANSDLSLFYLYTNTSKRVAVLDLDLPADRDRLRELARDADVLIEGFPPGYLAGRGLGYEQLSEINPGLIVTSITPFGQTGPYRDFRGDDIVAAAMGGLMFLGGLPDGPPSQPGGAIGSLSVMQSDVVAAVGTMLALAAKERSGRGQHVDVSMQEAVAIANENALGFQSVVKRIRRRFGTGTWSGTGTAIKRSKDGWITGVSRAGKYEKLVEWMGLRGLPIPEWISQEWWDANVIFGRSNQVSKLQEEIYLTYEGEELFEDSQRRHAGLAPIRTAAQVFEDRQFRARGFWVDVEQPGLGRALTYPGAPYLFSRTPWRISASAGANPEDAAGVAWQSRPVSSEVAPPGVSKKGESADAPLDGIVVVDFSWQIAAPLATKYLAAFGATVIKIESSGHPDGLRTAIDPRLPGNLGPEASHIFANFSAGKLSFGVDLNTTRGQELVRDLIAKADVVVDNYGVDPFPKWGMTYEELVEINPDLIMLRSSVMGRSGPCSHYSGNGIAIAAATGMHMLMGEENDPPVGTCTAHPDCSSNPHHTVVAILAALRYRNRTGEGQYIDLSQCESTAAFWGHALMDFTVNGVNPPRLGNRSPWSAPHGAYRTAAQGDDDDRWIAIACDSQEAWIALAGVLDPAWLDDPRFSDLDSRLANVGELDRLVGSATRTRDGYVLMAELQRAGAPAGVVQNHDDLVERDPHLKERGFYVWLDHPELGHIPHDGMPFQLSETPGKLKAPAPLLGQHNDFILSTLLGLDEEAINWLYVEETIE